MHEQHEARRFAVARTGILLWLATATLGIACVDLTPPWNGTVLQENGSSGGAPGTGGSPDGKVDDIGAAGTGGSTGTGGDQSSIDGAGGAMGSGGSRDIDTAGTVDSSIGTSGTGGTGGSVGTDGAVGPGGGVHTGGAVGAGGSVHTGGAVGTGGSAGTGGAVGTGGSARTGGAVGTGGNVGTGGAVGTGGNVGTGGSVSIDGSVGAGGMVGNDGSVDTGGGMDTGGLVDGAGGTSAVACGTTASTISQTTTFANQAAVTAYFGTAAGIGFSTTGPVANPTLCAAGCATYTLAFAAGRTAWTSSGMTHWFSPTTNLVGSTLTLSMAIDNPGGVLIQFQSFAIGDASTNWTWSATASLEGTGLPPYNGANGLKDLSLKIADHTNSGQGTFCASAAAGVGTSLQNTDPITASNAGTVTVYIGKVTIGP